MKKKGLPAKIMVALIKTRISTGKGINLDNK